MNWNFFSKNKAVEQPEAVNERSVAYTSTEGINVSDSDYKYTSTQADKLSIVYGAIRIRSNTIAQTPLKLYKKTEDGGSVEAVDHPYYRLLTRSINPFITNYQLWQWVGRQLDLTGNAFLHKIYDGKGLLTELEPMNVSSMEVHIDKDGVLTYSKNGDKSRTYSADEIIHFKGYSENGITGLSAIDTFRALFDNYSLLEAAGKDIVKNSVKAPHVIKHPAGMKDEEIKKAKENWATGFSSGNAGKAAWLPNTWTVDNIPNGLNATEAQLLENKQFTSVRIVVDIFGLPPHMLGLKDPTYASQEQSGIEFLMYTMQPIFINIEQTLNKALFDDGEEYFVKFNTKSLLRSSLNDRIQAYKFFIENGVMTPNQISAIEDLGIVIPTTQGGDTYYTSQQLKPAASGSL